MDIDKNIYSIFKRGSKTYFYSTIFFPRTVKEDVFTLYSFLRTSDDYVDAIPQDVESFYLFKERYKQAKNGHLTGDVVVDSFAELAQRKNFADEWVDAFLRSMEMDIHRSSYQTMEELKEYLYGSSEVVGLFMARIMDLEHGSFRSARYLGRAMQYINFIRDISEDIMLGRTYFPRDDLEKFNLESLSEDHTRSNPKNFIRFLNKQLETYGVWQNEAEAGFKYIPYRCLIPIKTASDMYRWTAKQISNDPFIVYRRKVKPNMPMVVFKVFSNSLSLGLS